MAGDVKHGDDITHGTSEMATDVKNAFELIDAAFFTGDTFLNEKAIEEAEEYMARWQRRIIALRVFKD